MSSNRGMNRFMRRVLYSLKRLYGGRIDLYKLGTVTTDYKTGVKTVTRTVVPIKRSIVLPVKIWRSIGPNTTPEFNYGGTYDLGTRIFVIDARDLPTDYVIEKDDWLVYNGQRYGLKNITELEQHTGWELLGQVVVGCQLEQLFVTLIEQQLTLTQVVS